MLAAPEVPPAELEVEGQRKDEDHGRGGR
eukprot:SAG22_NODE_19192_length_277_cov_0.848315_1_plen_28_part_01